MQETTLCVGDFHVEVGDTPHRATALGRYILDTRPDNIVMMGDYLSLDALSAWDLNKRANMEGRRFNEELQLGKHFMELIMNPVVQFNIKAKKNKKKRYTPRKIFLIGNHEDRWPRYLETKPELKGIVDPLERVGIYKYKWEVIPYRDYVSVNGVSFTHIPMNGINKPITANLSYMQNTAKDHEDSIVFGHTHRLAFDTSTRHGDDAKQIKSLNVGCFFDGMPEYAKGSKASKDWWRGVVVLHHLDKHGGFDFTTLTLDKMFKEYL